MSVQILKRARGFNSLRCEVDEDSRTRWCFMHREHHQQGYRPCFSEALLRDLHAFQHELAVELADGHEDSGPMPHLVLASAADVFNLGGDLKLFVRLIRERDRKTLLAYAQLCVEVAYNFDRLGSGRCHSIAVVQGDALGGGFEAALCCHTIIAEEGVGFGFPEVLFDLFPGMGAYSYLTRRISPAQAERMMLDGRVYPAEELFRLGVVDQVVPRGDGILAARDLIRRRRRIGNSLRSMNAVRATCAPVHLDELLAVTTAWVDAAMRLSERALQTMERLVRAQERRQPRQDSMRDAI